MAVPTFGSKSENAAWPSVAPSASPQVAPPLVDTETTVVEKLAPMYRVICHDDPVTPMDFVVEVFRTVFRIGPQRAVELMLGVHNDGSALIARYPKGLAEKRVNRAKALARADGFPLTFSIEKDV